jgi:DNA (cytosine-5)-methyltransferase 1
MGYHRAGFDVVGVDIEPQPHYPFEFVQDDALKFLNRMIGEPLDFDAVHASPPCQHYSVSTAEPGRHPDLYAQVRDLLEATGLPWVIENVIGSPYESGVVLCGGMFGMEIRRHRNFESSFMVMAPPHTCPREPWQVTGHLHRTKQVSKRHRKPDRETALAVMDCPWMDHEEVVLAIPPAYTEFVGMQLRYYLDHAERTRIPTDEVQQGGV